MTEVQLHYDGGLRCTAVHTLSGRSLVTDAPLDNNGLGQSFSPTDLVATGMGACMATIMGIVAQRKGLAIDGMAITVRKIMAADMPRRISKLELDIKMPLPADHPERNVLESAAAACPVKHSLHPDIELILNWQWAE